jgi:hypothetical protein
MLSRRVRTHNLLLACQTNKQRFRDPGRAIPDWPKLLHLYSRMRPGTTVFEWMQDHDVRSIGIDVRRFASFGVIKARPIHFTRAPMYLTFVGTGVPAPRTPLADDAQPTETKTTTLPPSPIGPRKRATSLTVPPLASSSIRAKRRTSDAMLAFATVSAHSTSGTVSLPPRAAEASLGTFRSRGSGPPSSQQTVRARHAAATPASLFEITQTLAVPRCLSARDSRARRRPLRSRPRRTAARRRPRLSGVAPFGLSAGAGAAP